MGWIEDLAAEMPTAGLTLDNHMLYTIFIDVLLAEYEVEAGNLASGDSIDRDEIINGVEERHRRLSGNKKWDPTLAMQAMLCTPAAAAVTVAERKGGGNGREKGRRREQHERGSRGTNEDGGGSAAAAGSDGCSAEATS